MLSFIFIIFHYVHVCLSRYVCMSPDVLRGQRYKALAAGIKSSCELLDVGSGDQTWSSVSTVLAF